LNICTVQWFLSQPRPFPYISLSVTFPLTYCTTVHTCSMVIIVSHHYDHLSINDLNDAGISLISMYYIQAYLQQMFSDSLPVLYSANSLYIPIRQSMYRGRILVRNLYKSLGLFLLAIHSHLYTFVLRFLFLQTYANSFSFFSSLLYTVKEKVGKPDRKAYLNELYVHEFGFSTLLYSHSFVSCMYYLPIANILPSPLVFYSTTHRSSIFVVILFMVDSIKFSNSITMCTFKCMIITMHPICK